MKIKGPDSGVTEDMRVKRHFHGSVLCVFAVGLAIVVFVASLVFLNYPLWGINQEKGLVTELLAIFLGLVFLFAVSIRSVVLQARLAEAVLTEKRINEKNEELGREIAIRKRAEEKMEENETKYRELVELLPQAVFETDIQGKITFANQYALKSLGYTWEECGEGLNILHLIDPRDRDGAAVNIAAVLEGTRIVGHEYRLRTKEGRQLQVMAYTTPIVKNGKTLGLRGIIADITELRNAGAALKEREIYLQTIFGAIQTGILVVDAQTHLIVDANKITRTLTGRHKGELVGAVCHKIVCPAEVGKCPITDLGLKMDNSERQVLHKNGKLIPVIKSVVSVTINGRECLLESFVDISARKEMEEELRRAKEDADEANRLKSQFLANMSHEIRTPMNGVIGFAEMLFESELGHDQREYARTIKKSGEDLLSIIDDILDLSKIEAGNVRFEEIDFDPELIVYDVCELVRPRIGEKPVEILCRVGDHVPSYLKGDPVRFRQVLLNLMGNAAKFTPAGEIELSMDAKDEPDGSVRVVTSVRDTGIGIRKDKLEVIFEAFRQEDTSTTRQYGGTGLGLAISRRLAVLMKGRIWVESLEGQGSTFYFEASMKRSEKKNSVSVQPLPLMGRKVLIVDDNKTNLDILGYVLGSYGMKASLLPDGRLVPLTLQEAADGGCPFDICILDIRMPEMNGYEVAKSIRGSDRAFRDIPLIAFSSSTVSATRDCTEAGFNGFIPKPIRKQKLLEVIMNILAVTAPDGDTEGGAPFVTQHTVREAAKRSVRILLVEDNEINRKLAGLLLAQGGYQVDTADNGREAVDKFRTDPGRYDLIFMDIQMPEMDGYEASRTIRESGFDRIPIIALTANAMKGEREKCIDAGMNDFIPKPMKRDVVFNKIDRWVLKRNMIV